MQMSVKERLSPRGMRDLGQVAGVGVRIVTCPLCKGESELARINPADLRALREKYGVTQAQLRRVAKKPDGTPPTTAFISNVERGLDACPEWLYRVYLAIPETVFVKEPRKAPDRSARRGRPYNARRKYLRDEPKDMARLQAIYQAIEVDKLTREKAAAQVGCSVSVIDYYRKRWMSRA